MPALYHLDEAGHLPDDLHIVACGRRQWSTADFIAKLRPWLQAKARGGIKAAVYQRFIQRIVFRELDLSQRQHYKQLADFLDAQHYGKNRAYYMAVPPMDFEPVIRQLSEFHFLDESHGFRRVVIEKPFGHDLKSARQLQQLVARYLNEQQVFRIDH